MAAVEVTISGVLYDKFNRTTQQVVLIGEATLTGIGVGGGPIIPPAQPPGEPGIPTFPIAGYPDFPYPSQPIYRPGYPGGSPPPSFPRPPVTLPPEVTPPNPGDPPTALPPPAGSAGWPVQGIVPPPFIIVNYPGVGPIVVAPPATAATTPPAQPQQ
jgi:hypothetical protein